MQVYFKDSFERLNFVDCIQGANPKTLVNEDIKQTQEVESNIRFSIVKTNKVGVKKKRIISILVHEMVLVETFFCFLLASTLVCLGAALKSGGEIV